MTRPSSQESAPLWDFYAEGGTECVLCHRKVKRPVNRNAHAEMHVRKGEAYREWDGYSHIDRYYALRPPRVR